MNQTMAFVYGDVNKIDPWVGLLAENHMPDALFGTTAMTIIKQQFMALRNGDRYYYENDSDLTGAEKLSIKQTRLADVIRRNCTATIIEDEIFKVQSFATATEDIAGTGGIDFAMYPNPVQQMVFLRIPSASHVKAEIRIADMQGRILMQREAQLAAGNNTLTLTLPGEFVPGLYVMSIQADHLTGQKLFYKED